MTTNNNRMGSSSSTCGVTCIVAALLWQVVVISDGMAEELPCPDDCIAMFELLWSGSESEEIVQSAINDITDDLVRRGYEDISGLAIQQNRYVFVVFKSECYEKDRKLGALLTETFGFLMAGVEFRVMTGAFVRGPNTVDFDGEYWDRRACCVNRQTLEDTVPAFTY